ncbi:MAG: hypothetical protein M3252_06930 [Actinomycetota bacterium]|nr:hypothetical protein [Actinomycetota bacterium]
MTKLVYASIMSLDGDIAAHGGLRPDLAGGRQDRPGVALSVHPGAGSSLLRR